MAVAPVLDSYQSQFEEFAARRANVDPPWLASLRSRAIARFAALGFPTTRDEEWKFTPVSSIADTVFARPDDAAVSADQLTPFVPEDLPGPRLVFVNGRYAPGLSVQTALPDGVRITTLADALADQAPAVERHFGRGVPFDRHAFTALNSAFLEDGAYVHVSAGVDVSVPVHVMYFSTATTPTVSHPRTLVVVEANARLSLVESYAGTAGHRYLTNAVTEFVGGPGSYIDHVRVQRESFEAGHVSSTHVDLDRDAVFAQQNIVLGGGLVRNDIAATLGASGIEATLNGLYLGHGTRLIDNHTTIDHAHPHCASHEIYKGMLDGQSRGVFNGKIFVRQDAQKTDAKQTNKVLLLSDDATINTKPQLEIYADDVKCTHGATVGQLDPEMLFYLRARGIGYDEARALLVHAFASDVIDRVTLEPLRVQLEEALLQQLPK